MTYQRSASNTAIVAAPAEDVFAFLDDPTVLGVHMEKPSVMMLGATMRYDLDDAKGRAAGSVIKMTGSVLGIGLYLEEVVTDRLPPLRKIWETRGPVRLLVIGSYRMGFRIEPAARGCRVEVLIEYDLPEGLLGGLLGRLVGRTYADWCVRKMATEAYQFGLAQPASAGSRGT
jgi:hypothetical protein